MWEGLDETDKRIIRELQREARLTNVELAERVNLSPSPCLRRVRMLEKAGVINRYVAVVDRAAAGFAVTAYANVTLSRHDKDVVEGFETKMRETPEVLTCHLMTGASDYLLQIVVADLSAYERFMRETMQLIPGLATINTSLVYGTVKDTAELP